MRRLNVFKRFGLIGPPIQGLGGSGAVIMVALRFPPQLI